MTSYKILYSKAVVKTILKYEKHERERLYKAFENLPSGDIKRLQGQNNPPYYRLRIGNIRALFVKDEIKKEILIFDVNSRGDIYK